MVCPLYQTHHWCVRITLLTPPHTDSALYVHRSKVFGTIRTVPVQYLLLTETRNYGLSLPQYYINTPNCRPINILRKLLVNCANHIFYLYIRLNLENFHCYKQGGVKKKKMQVYLVTNYTCQPILQLRKTI